MQELHLHPSCAPGPIDSASADLRPTDKGCEVEFRLRGKVSRIELPEKAQSERTDNLWRTTCFEFFWQPDGGTAYREFNLSPSTRWAAYDFDDVRTVMRKAPVNRIEISCTNGEGELNLLAVVEADLPLPARAALSAIVEYADGNQQFWGLGFSEGKPDFHSEVGRRLLLAERP